MSSFESRALLRHTLATLAYRAGRCLEGAGENVANFRAGDGTRTPVEILAHIGDLLDWAVSMTRGKQVWHDSAPLGWDEEVRRFYAGLAELDAHLAGDAPLACPVEKLFQGPVADAFTHIGQIALLRRMAGSPVRGENYAVAAIEAGRVGRDQAAPKRQFD